MFDYAALETVFVNYILSAIHAGKYDELNHLGLDLESIKLFKEMSELQCLPRDFKNKLIQTIHVDREGLRKMLHYTKQSMALGSMLEALLRAGACNQMLQEFFGMTNKELSNRRKVLDCDTPPKRRTVISEARKREIVKDIEQRWASRAHHPDGLHKQCSILLEVAQQQCLPINDLWRAVNAAVARGEFSWDYPLACANH